MTTRIAHRAQLYAMNFTIQMLNHTRKSSPLSAAFRSAYQVFRREGVVLWSGIFLSLSLAGFLFGYVIYYLVP